MTKLKGCKITRRGFTRQYLVSSVDYEKNLFLCEIDDRVVSIPFKEVFAKAVNAQGEEFDLIGAVAVDAADYVTSMPEATPYDISAGWDLGDEPAELEEWEKSPVDEKLVELLDAIQPDKPKLKSKKPKAEKAVDNSWMEAFTNGDESSPGDGSRWDEI